MDKSKKVATAATVATESAMSVSGERGNQQQYQTVMLSDTTEILLHAIQEAALQESRTRVPR